MSSLSAVSLPSRPHFGDEALGVSIYFTDPPGMIVRYKQGTAFEAPIATFVSVQGYAALQKRFPGSTKFHFVQDFSGAVSYTTEARQIMTSWGKRIKDATVMTVVVPPPLNPVLQMGITTALAVLNVAGARIEVAKTLVEAVGRHGLKVV